MVVRWWQFPAFPLPINGGYFSAFSINGGGEVVTSINGGWQVVDSLPAQDNGRVESVFFTLDSDLLGAAGLAVADPFDQCFPVISAGEGEPTFGAAVLEAGKKLIGFQTGQGGADLLARKHKRISASYSMVGCECLIFFSAPTAGTSGDFLPSALGILGSAYLR